MHVSFLSLTPFFLARSYGSHSCVAGDSCRLGSDAVSLEICFRRFEATQCLHLQQPRSLLKMKALRCLGALGPTHPRQSDGKPFFLSAATASPYYLRSLISRLRSGFLEGSGLGRGLCFMCAPRYVLPQNNLTHR